MRDEARTREKLVLGRRLVQEQRGRVVIDGAGVFHSAELKRRYQHEVELLERIFAIRVGLEPLECLLMQIEDGFAIGGDLRGIRFAVIEVKHAAVSLSSLDRELAGDEAEQVGRKRLRLTKPDRRAIGRRLAPDLGRIRHRRPFGRNLQRQRQRILDIGLIETGKRSRRASGDEQRVEILVVPVQGLVAGREIDVDDVLATNQCVCRDDEMAVLRSDRRRAGRWPEWTTRAPPAARNRG